MAETAGRLNATILIPAYNPDEKLLRLLPQLKERFSRIVLVDDGSTRGQEIFTAAAGYVEKILVHERNRGKGAALKTGLRYIGGTSDVITADADGQHTCEDIVRVAIALASHRKGLVLGSRAFAGRVPLRSRFGNVWTRYFFFLMTGLMVRDTQTGLRGIPAGLVERIASIPGERYEYEMAMLADAKHHEEKPFEVPIATIYIEENRASHFNPLLDTIRIYRSLFQFCLSSVLSFLLDNGIFAAIIWMLSSKETARRDDILVAMALSRAVSSHFNYLYNRFVVFSDRKRNSTRHRSYYSYFGLVVVIALASYVLTEGSAEFFDIKGVAITAVKIVADVVLFFASYFIQRKFIFRKG